MIYLFLCVLARTQKTQRQQWRTDRQTNEPAGKSAAVAAAGSIGRVDQAISQSVDQSIRLVRQQFINSHSYTEYSISHGYVVIQLVLPAGANPFCNYRLPVGTYYNYLLKQWSKHNFLIRKSANAAASCNLNGSLTFNIFSFNTSKANNTF